ncbi:type II toxin-antitoxin system HicB family antitoxin [Helicobacter sp. MIT 11-5569]|uniref:type II toxin-antitoxin system HicB family antitoxin n=1 Tax=Helicobacter sp. MIT 11-5569 TaxID=1548151 RepID=UPI00051FCEDE|nr:type II toxin-antitoxin system HicB family antitoxin [Helicobacter sp. MIT 11-5569]TLD85198.1 type II toxin-antitoxin system HicB family antitoxin [Helicobacter sp. MIT 11-5569]
MILNAVIEKDEFGYFAYVPELKGCVSQGETYEEAITNIKEAIQLYLESLNEKETESLKNKIFSIVPIEITEIENARVS